MTNYSEDESMVRVDFFKPSGKWSHTRAIKWTGGYRDCCIHEAFNKSLTDAGVDVMSDMVVVCLEPYHENAHPLKVIR